MKPLGSYDFKSMRCVVTNKSIDGVWEAYQKSEEEWNDNVNIIKVLLGEQTKRPPTHSFRGGLFSLIFSEKEMALMKYKLIPNTKLFRSLYKNKLLAHYKNFILVEK